MRLVRAVMSVVVVMVVHVMPGMGLVRMIRPWNEWLINWGYDISQGVPDVDNAFAEGVARDLIGDPDIDIEITSVSTWTVNNCYATRTQKGRVFCMGDAIHRHIADIVPVLGVFRPGISQTHDQYHAFLRRWPTGYRLGQMGAIFITLLSSQPSVTKTLSTFGV